MRDSSHDDGTKIGVKIVRGIKLPVSTIGESICDGNSRCRPFWEFRPWTRQTFYLEYVIIDRERNRRDYSIITPIIDSFREPIVVINQGHIGVDRLRLYLWHKQTET